MDNPPILVECRGYAAIDKEVKGGTTSGRVFVPLSWVGKKVKVILLDP